MTTVKCKQAQVEAFVAYAKDKTIVAGYGSLLSKDSRQRHSNILSPVIPVVVHHWERSWITRSEPEQQTYVGAQYKEGAKLNACLLALDMDPDFIERERDYRFTLLSQEACQLYNVDQAIEAVLKRHISKVYICESLAVSPSDANYPVNYSYINTCLQGAKELMGQAGMDDFIRYTKGWDTGVFYDDMQEVKYPRASFPLLPHFKP